MRNLPKPLHPPTLLTLAMAVMVAAVASAALLLPAGAQAGSAGKANVADDIPECGASTPAACHVDITVHQGSITQGAFCDSFDRDEGLCVGGSTGTPAFSMPGYSPKYGIETSFTWKSHGAPRDVDYTANANALIVDSYIRGDVPASNSAVFNVNDAYSRASGAHWKTMSTGAAPGRVGGPLYIDYDHPRSGIGSSIHIFGYLVRK
ncbi:MAG TPA: hypothetical protein VJL81_11350 [Solirubrobacterales bacterium]|nr:hypothetical protein [Solirubrobacterales bacterium]